MTKEEKFQFNPTVYGEDSFTVRDISHAQEERAERRKIEQERNAARKEKRRRQARARSVVLVAIIVALLTTVALLGKNIFNLWDLRAQKAAAEQELEALQNQKGALEEELEQVNSDEYIEQQARSDLKMIRPGEILYLFKDKDKD